MRETVDCDRPLCSAIDRVDQCVAPFGLRSRVAAINSATCSSVTVRGAPERGMSPSPAMRCSTNLERHRPTACGVEPSFSATSLFDAPVAHSRMIRQRNAQACEVERRRTQPSSAARSSSLNTNSAFGRPVRATGQAYSYEQN